MRVINERGVPLGLAGQLQVSLEPGSAGLRIDFPSVVHHVDKGRDIVGLSFCGAPVITHQRIALRSNMPNKAARLGERAMRARPERRLGIAA
jgi:hypothetical protein